MSLYPSSTTALAAAPGACPGPTSRAKTGPTLPVSSPTAPGQARRRYRLLRPPSPHHPCLLRTPRQLCRRPPLVPCRYRRPAPRRPSIGLDHHTPRHSPNRRPAALGSHRAQWGRHPGSAACGRRPSPTSHRVPWRLCLCPGQLVHAVARLSPDHLDGGGRGWAIPHDLGPAPCSPVLRAWNFPEAQSSGLRRQRLWPMMRCPGLLVRPLPGEDGSDTSGEGKCASADARRPPPHRRPGGPAARDRHLLDPERRHAAAPHNGGVRPAGPRRTAAVGSLCRRVLRAARGDDRAHLHRPLHPRGDRGLRPGRHHRAWRLRPGGPGRHLPVPRARLRVVGHQLHGGRPRPHPVGAPQRRGPGHGRLPGHPAGHPAARLRRRGDRRPRSRSTVATSTAAERWPRRASTFTRRTAPTSRA